jgi:hypothetical protein
MTPLLSNSRFIRPWAAARPGQAWAGGGTHLGEQAVVGALRQDVFVGLQLLQPAQARNGSGLKLMDNSRFSMAP